MALHWKHQLFVEEYLANPTLNAAEVAVRAGYERKWAKNRAYELLKDPEVKAAIEHGRKLILEKAHVTAEAVLQDILDTRQRCVENGDNAWAVAGRLKCNELLGKFLGMWQEKETNPTDDLAQRLAKARQNLEREQPTLVGQLKDAPALTGGGALAEVNMPQTDDQAEEPPGEPRHNSQPLQYDDWVSKLV